MSDEGRKRTKLRQGLLRQQANVIATRAGILKRQRGKTQKLTVLNRQKRVRQLATTTRPCANVCLQYIPRAGDLVVGTVLEKHAENYNLDVGGPIHARLPTLAFEGATKRNRPNIPVLYLCTHRATVNRCLLIGGGTCVCESRGCKQTHGTRIVLHLTALQERLGHWSIALRRAHGRISHHMLTSTRH